MQRRGVLEYVVLPAQAGVILLTIVLLLTMTGAPRAGGGDPSSRQI